MGALPARQLDAPIGTACGEFARPGRNHGALGERVKHEWLRDERGEIAMQELGGLHRGPTCLRCGRAYCRHCVKVGVDGGGRSLADVLDEDCAPSRPTPV